MPVIFWNNVKNLLSLSNNLVHLIQPRGLRQNNKHWIKKGYTPGCNQVSIAIPAKPLYTIQHASHIHDIFHHFTIVSCCFENSGTVSECWFYSSQMLLTGSDPPLLQLLQLWLNFKSLVLSSFLYTINMFETSVANAPLLRLIFNQYTVGLADRHILDNVRYSFMTMSCHYYTKSSILR